jgi:murein DD-endopeptidase MepM/ murein hydrolase activator NlpD
MFLAKELVIQSITGPLQAGKRKYLSRHSCHSTCQERKFKTYGWFWIPYRSIYKARKMHEGMDFTAKVGTQFMQLATVVRKLTIEASGYGNHIVIRHGYGYKPYMDI